MLSTSNNDVFAILEYTGNLREIYKTDRINLRREINMIGGDVKNMTSDEMKEYYVTQIFPNLSTPSYE